ncbi:MAG: histidinol-phosphate transaminase [Deltaproteobacteria bacterium]|nr:histidinol-phosphate transaminase [Deltaproteobacteria bacterium]
MKNLFRREIRQSKAYELKAFSRIIKLNQNELPTDFPQEFKTELFKKLQKLEFNRYPLIQPLTLQKKLAQDLKVEPNQLLFSNGSNVMIQALVLATANRGKVLIAPPTFGVYESEAKLLGNKIITVPLEGKTFQFPKQKLIKKLKEEKPNLCFLCNPNAPTGNLFSREDLSEVIQTAKCLVVLDEAYCQFSKESLLPDLEKYPNLVILRTFSKGFGLGGIRLGYTIAHEQIIDQLKKVLLPFCISAVTEIIAVEALKHQKYFKRQIDIIIKERNRVYQELEKLESIECFPSSTNFILFRAKDAKVCFNLLLKHHVLIRDFSHYPGLRNCLRVSIGLPKENDVFIKAMKNFEKLGKVISIDE